MRQLVSLIRCPDYDYKSVKRAVRDSIELLGGLNSIIQGGEKVLLKPNLLSPKTVEKAVTTHPMVVKAIGELVKEAGGRPYIWDSPSIGSTTWVAKKSGISQIADEINIPVLEDKEIVTLNAPKDFIFTSFEIAKNVLDADLIINIPKLKTHSMMTLTLAVKNLFGVIPGFRKARWHLIAGNKFFARMLIELYLLVKPKLNIIDGRVGMEGNGPGNGIPKKIGLIAASFNALALDRVLVEVLNLDPEIVPTLKEAKRSDLEGWELNKIDIMGYPIDSVKTKRFKLPEHMDVQWGLPRPIKRVLKDTVTVRPYIDLKLCKLCKSCYDICPGNAISIIDDKPIIDYNECIRCFCCQEVCPEGAVKIKKGLFLKIFSH